MENNLTAIFAHPTLQSLTMSCADIDGPFSEKVLSRPETPLKELELIECNVRIQALDAILSMPKALERLCLGTKTQRILMLRPD